MVPPAPMAQSAPQPPVNAWNQPAQSAYPGYPPQYAQPPVQKKTSGLAIAALVLGICGIVFSFCCVGAPFGIAAIVFGIVALAKKAFPNGMSVAGIIMGGVSILLSIVMILYALAYTPAFLEGVQDGIQSYYDEYFDGYDRSYNYDYYQY